MKRIFLLLLLTTITHAAKAELLSTSVDDTLAEPLPSESPLATSSIDDSYTLSYEEVASGVCDTSDCGAGGVTLTIKFTVTNQSDAPVSFIMRQPNDDKPVPYEVSVDGKTIELGGKDANGNPIPLAIQIGAGAQKTIKVDVVLSGGKYDYVPLVRKSVDYQLMPAAPTSTRYGTVITSSLKVTGTAPQAVPTKLPPIGNP